jgi:hypothetical protein
VTKKPLKYKGVNVRDMADEVFRNDGYMSVFEAGIVAVD